MEDKVNGKSELLSDVKVTENFYVEELEHRLEMAAAPVIPNDYCFTWVIPF